MQASPDRLARCSRGERIGHEGGLRALDDDPLGPRQQALHLGGQRVVACDEHDRHAVSAEAHRVQPRLVVRRRR